MVLFSSPKHVFPFDNSKGWSWTATADIRRKITSELLTATATRERRQLRVVGPADIVERGGGRRRDRVAGRLWHEFGRHSRIGVLFVRHVEAAVLERQTQDVVHVDFNLARNLGLVADGTGDGIIIITTATTITRISATLPRTPSNVRISCRRAPAQLLITSANEEAAARARQHDRGALLGGDGTDVAGLATGLADGGAGLPDAGVVAGGLFIRVLDGEAPHIQVQPRRGVAAVHARVVAGESVHVEEVDSGARDSSSGAPDLGAEFGGEGGEGVE